MTTKMFVLYTTISTIVLMGCVISKNTVRDKFNSFSFETDSINCQTKDWENWHPNLLPTVKIKVKKGESNFPYSSKYTLLNVTKSILFFQFGDSIYTLDLSTSKSAYFKKNNFTQSNNIYGRTNTTVMFVDNNTKQPNSIITFNQILKSIYWSNISLENLLSIESEKYSLYPSQIHGNSDSSLFYIKNYTLYTVNQNFKPLDSLRINTCYLSKVSDYKKGFLLFLINDIFIPVGKNEVCLFDLNKKNSKIFSLPLHSNHISSIISLRFSKSDTNKIYYIEKNWGLYEYNMITQTERKIIELCPERNIIDFLIDQDSSKIYAQSDDNKIYEIDLLSLKSKPKVLTLH